MGIGGWFSQNWFNLFSATGVIAGLWFTAFSLRADTKMRRIANLLTITANHREVWSKILLNPEVKRVLNPAADPVKQSVTDDEEIVVSLVIAHINSVFYAMSDKLLVEYDGLRRDVAQFFSLPVPKAVWLKTKLLQNQDFAAFVDSCLINRLL